MPYKNIVLFCMSGTGNSYRTAEWFQQQAEAQGIPTRIIPVDNRRPQEALEDSPDTLVGIIMPTHAFTAPWLIYRWVSRLSRQKRTHAFCLATRACIKFGPLYVPGINGSGNFLVALLLALKGYRVRGIMSVDMPSNWIAFHSGLKPANAEAIIHRAQPRVERFAENILSGKTVWLTRNNGIELLWGIILLYVSILYLLIGRFFLAKIFFTNQRCNGCRICAEQCPVQAIKMVGAPEARPFWKYKCESCMRCMAYCPTQAIEASQSWAAALWKLSTLSLWVYGLNWIYAKIPYLNTIHNGGLQFVFQLLSIYFVLIISYYAFHSLSRIPIVNTLFTYTTLTPLYRRYHEPQTPVSALHRKR